MVATTGGMVSFTKPVAESRSRLSLPSACAGALVTLGCAALTGAALAALGLSLHGGGTTLGRLQWTGLVTGGAILFWIASWIGGRVAAFSGRALARGDGALHGLVAWAVLTVVLAVLIVGFLAIGTKDGLTGLWWRARSSLHDPAWREAATPRAAVLAEILWAGIACQLVACVAAVMGGIAGARSEARAIGLLAVRPPSGTTRTVVMAADSGPMVPAGVSVRSYEQTFFAEG